MASSCYINAKGEFSIDRQKWENDQDERIFHIDFYTTEAHNGVIRFFLIKEEVMITLMIKTNGPIVTS